MHQAWRGFKALLGFFAFSLGDRLLNRYLDDQDKSGHDIGQVGHVILSLAPFWVPIVAAVIGLIYIFWPTINKLSGGERITAKVIRFEMLDAKDLSELEVRELWEEFGKANPGFWYRALVEIDNFGKTNRAKEWRFQLRRNDGASSECTPVSKQWAAPKHWPHRTYYSLDDVSGQYLAADQLYNVFLHIITPTRLADLDMRSFEVRFRDSSGREIVGKMDSESAPSWLRQIIENWRRRPAQDQVHFESSFRPTGTLNAELTKAAAPTSPMQFKDLGGPAESVPGIKETVTAVVTPHSTTLRGVGFNLIADLQMYARSREAREQFLYGWTNHALGKRLRRLKMQLRATLGLANVRWPEGLPKSVGWINGVITHLQSEVNQVKNDVLADPSEPRPSETLSSEVETWLFDRETKHPNYKLDSGPGDYDAQGLQIRDILRAGRGDPFDKETIELFNQLYAPRARDVLADLRPRAKSYSLNAEKDALVRDGPNEPSDIRHITEYLRLLEGD